tara:strand:+ start:1056 stop:1277 length:222 start_codon:yes stop_codon:yes gene_type:complete
MTNLKLFIWEDVLCDHSCGIAFALAKTLEDARKIIFSKSMQEAGYVSNTLKTDLESEPKVVDNEEGFYIWGGG